MLELLFGKPFNVLVFKPPLSEQPAKYDDELRIAVIVLFINRSPLFREVILDCPDILGGFSLCSATFELFQKRCKFTLQGDVKRSSCDLLLSVRPFEVSHRGILESGVQREPGSFGFRWNIFLDKKGKKGTGKKGPDLFSFSFYESWIKPNNSKGMVINNSMPKRIGHNITTAIKNPISTA